MGGQGLLRGKILNIGYIVGGMVTIEIKLGQSDEI